MKVLWTIYIVFACLIGLGGFIFYMGATSAPQQAAIACFALAGVGIPFMILRACTEIALVKASAEGVVRQNIRDAMAANPKHEAEGVDQGLIERMTVKP